MPPNRKRSNTVSSATQSTMDPQPSSRDASGEDIEDPVLQEVMEEKERQTESHVSSKRARSTKSNADSDEDESVARKSRRTSASGSSDKKAAYERRRAWRERRSWRACGCRIHPRPAWSTQRATRRTRRLWDAQSGCTPMASLTCSTWDTCVRSSKPRLAFPDTYLIVGVTGDKETHRRKGLTVLSAKERAESVRHCKWVDEVVEDCPWIISDAPEFIEKHKIDYVAHDDIPYGADEGDDIYAPIKEKGMFLVTQRTEGLSTTGIITKWAPPCLLRGAHTDDWQNCPRLRPVHRPPAETRHIPQGAERIVAQEERAGDQA